LAWYSALLLLCATVGHLAVLRAYDAHERQYDNPVVHLPPLPDSIPRLLASVDLVVLGQVVGTSDPRVEEYVLDGMKRHTVLRYHRVRVLEVLKSDAGAHSPQREHITFRQPGGTVDSGGRKVVTTPLEPILRAGNTAILFLNRVPTEPNIYFSPYGPAGILAVQPDQMVEVPGQMQKMPELLHRERIALEQVLALIRGAGL